MSKTIILPDPAAEFGAAISIYQDAQEAAERNRSNLSDAYSGADEFMRQCMRIGRDFEAWACTHVDFDRLTDVWPYLLEDKFGAAALQVAISECHLSELRDSHWPLVAEKLSLHTK